MASWYSPSGLGPPISRASVFIGKNHGDSTSTSSDSSEHSAVIRPSTRSPSSSSSSVSASSDHRGHVVQHLRTKPHASRASVPVRLAHRSPSIGGTLPARGPYRGPTGVPHGGEPWPTTRRYVSVTRDLAGNVLFDHLQHLSWTPEEIEQEQTARLRTLLRTAVDGSSWHRDRLLTSTSTRSPTPTSSSSP